MSDGLLRVAAREGLVVLRLEGELRHLLADALEHSIEVHLRPGLRQLVLDLDAARFMDSTIIGMLVLAARRAAELGAPTLLLCPQGELWQQLIDLHLDQLFERADAIEEALPEATTVGCAKVSDEAAQTALVLRAHRALVAQDPRNAETFAGLIALLEASIGDDPGR